MITDDRNYLLSTQVEQLESTQMTVFYEHEGVIQNHYLVKIQLNEFYSLNFLYILVSDTCFLVSGHQNQRFSYVQFDFLSSVMLLVMATLSTMFSQSKISECKE